MEIDSDLKKQQAEQKKQDAIAAKNQSLAESHAILEQHRAARAEKLQTARDRAGIQL